MNIVRCRVHVRLQVPFMFKYAVDGLTMDPTGGTALGPYIALTPAALIAGYGAARAGSALCNELRNATFAKVLLTRFVGLLSLSLPWHPAAAHWYLVMG